MVSPMTMGLIFHRRASEDAPSTKKFAPLMRINNPRQNKRNDIKTIETIVTCF